jgi:hypothetical protein
MKDIEKLANALNLANEAAKKVSGTKDGGSCNMDAPTILLTGWRQPDINKVNAISSVKLSKKIQSRWWRKSRFVEIDLEGCASCRTAMAEACVNSLKSSGYDAAVFYQLD